MVTRLILIAMMYFCQENMYPTSFGHFPSKNLIRNPILWKLWHFFGTVSTYSTNIFCQDLDIGLRIKYTKAFFSFLILVTSRKIPKLLSILEIFTMSERSIEKVNLVLSAVNDWRASDVLVEKVAVTAAAFGISIHKC